ncbi:MAG: PorT family protein [Microscillaceae bacterium]|jgi:hypothetical protein|nr:PorT family protein [Microscillaceae bacterium]
MRKNFFYILLFVLLYDNTNAQILIMPRGGITYSNMAINDNFRRSTLTGNAPRYNLGSMFGVSVNLPIAGPFSIQPEINYVQKGLKLLYEDFDSDEEYTEKYQYFLNYVEVPILGSLQFGDQNVQVIINLGPYVAYGTGGKFRYKEEYVDINTPANSESLTENYKIRFDKEPENYTGDDQYIDNAFDFGFQAGLGLGINAGPGFIVLEQRFGMGLLNLLDKPEVSTEPNLKLMNRNFYISLGYTIPIGGSRVEEGGGIEKKNIFKRRR